MAILKYYSEYRNFPKLDGKASVIIRGESLFLCKDESEIWITIAISQAEKRELLKTLLREFLDMR